MIATHTSPSSSGEPTPLRVLLVSKDQAFAKRLNRAQLEFADIRVKRVGELSQALPKIQRADALNAIIVDCDLPGGITAAALRVLIAGAPALPVLLIGGSADDVDDLISTRHGGLGYCVKADRDASTLKLALHNAIARQSRRAGGLSLGTGRAQAVLDALGDAIGDAVLCLDGKWLVTYLNPIAEKIIGKTHAEVAGRTLSDVFHLIDATTRERILPTLELAALRGRHLILPPNCVLVRGDGTECQLEDSAAPIFDERGNFAGMVIVFHDVGESRATARRMTHLAEYDALTSLPNRALLDDRLDQGISLARRHGRQLAVLFVDLDHFKHINDSLGHLVGDQLLRAVAQRIIPCVRHSDTVGRLGGDEFIVLLPEVAHITDARIIAEKIRLALTEPFTIGSHYLHLSASIGVSVYPGDGEDAQTLIQYADTAMYHAKERGRNNCQFFRQDMNVHAAERQILTEDLRNALLRGEFLLEYQPKIDLLGGALTGVEALVRWQHPSRGLLYPQSFIPIAEENGMIIAVGRWVLREACLQAQRWIAADLEFGTMAVNISAVEFRSERFFEEICAVLTATGFPPNKLELELTETAVMRNYEDTSVVLHALSDMGVSIAVDDFGTGYSNLSYLKRFPINTLKLDKSFIQDIPAGADASTIVSSVTQMARSLHLRVVAEGIENVAQLKFLRGHACGEGQGYLFSKPLKSCDLETLLFAAQHWLPLNAAASQNAEMPVAETSLAAAQLQVHNLTQKLMVAHETERSHIARELHDDVQQLLFGLSLKMLLPRAFTGQLAIRHVNEWRGLLGEVIDHLQALTSRLRVPVLNDRGLVAAIQDHVERLRAETRAEIRLRVDPNVPAVAETIALACFRIVQEALTNALKHSGARVFQVSLQYVGGFLFVGFRDDGRGFDVSSALRRANAGGHIGLSSMRERVAMMGGDIQIRASVGNGTVIRVFVPLQVSVLPRATLVTAEDDAPEQTNGPGDLQRSENEKGEAPSGDKHPGYTIIVTDKEGIIEWVNEEFTRICGYRLDEAVGRVPGKLLQGPATDSREVARIRHAIRSKKGVSAEVVNYTKQGRLYRVNMKVEPLVNARGEVDAFVAFASELTATQGHSIAAAQDHTLSEQTTSAASGRH